MPKDEILSKSSKDKKRWKTKVTIVTNHASLDEGIKAIIADTIRGSTTTRAGASSKKIFILAN